MSKHEPICQHGDIWMIGDYVIICADAEQCDFIIHCLEAITGQKAKLDGVE